MPQAMFHEIASDNLNKAVVSAREVTDHRLFQRALAKGKELYFPKGDFSIEPITEEELAHMVACFEADGKGTWARALRRKEG